MQVPDIKKRILLILSGVVVAGVLIYALAVFPTLSAAPPKSFMDARQAASITSKQIVDLTNLTSEKIKQVNVSSLGGQEREQALSLIRDARATNTQAYQKAFELSQNLQRLAETLNEIKSADAQRIAYDSVATELSLVSEFIGYTQSLNTFLDNLGILVSSNTIKNQETVRANLQEVNSRAAQVNTLNNTFNQKMQQLDKMF